jgi:Protein of unknown function (DUF3617)
VHQIIRGVAAVSLLAAVGAAFAADSGTEWRITTSFSGMGMNMPSRVSQSCVAGTQQNQPPPATQGDCQTSELSRNDSTVRYAVQCKNMKGTGEITYSADHYVGKFDMQSDRGTMTISYQGQKVGPCDPQAGSQVKAGIDAGASEVKGAATDVATDAAQSVKDDATQSAKNKAENALKGLFSH